MLESYTNTDGLKVMERFFNVPLDYANPSEKIRIFAQTRIPKSKARTVEDEEKLPYFVFLGGGPGFEFRLDGNPGFVAEIHNQGFKTLWMDPRGTGLSTHTSCESLPSRLVTDQDKANYLKHFRADSIVKDCEEIRKVLLGDKPDAEDQKWTIMGSSFGGFCAITYLSFFPSGLKEVFLSAGLPPLVGNPDRVYASLLPNDAAILKKRNQMYYDKYPQDIKRVASIEYIASLSISQWFWYLCHPAELVFRVANDLETIGKITYKTLQLPRSEMGRSPSGGAGPTIFMGARQGSSQNRTHSLLWRNGFPETFDGFVNLRPLKGVAEILANDSSWAALYDVEQLKKNEVRVSAATYVEFCLVQETALTIKNTEQYITNQLLHDGIYADGTEVMKRLFRVARRE
ncbi:alpha/beta-hydrolase [Mycena vulgaris]|nr:alpha/beta-hydrolase [Mycena vulgaris]